MLVDSHCHLNFEQLSTQLDDVVRRAELANVGHMLTIGTKLREFDAVRAIAEQYDNIHCSVGIHPHEAEEEGADVTVEKLLELANHPKVVAIGETGLDYFYEHSPRGSKNLFSGSYRRGAQIWPAVNCSYPKC